jgi:hypothetical protein
VKIEPNPIPEQSKSKTDSDLEKLLAVWKQATPEAKRVFGEVALCIDGWPAAAPITEEEAMDGSKWSRK